MQRKCKYIMKLNYNAINMVNDSKTSSVVIRVRAHVHVRCDRMMMPVKRIPTDCTRYALEGSNMVLPFIEIHMVETRGRSSMLSDITPIFINNTRYSEGGGGGG